MRRVKRILEAKGYDIWYIEPAASVYEAIHLLAEKQIGALLVMENDQLVGIFSERDYARQIILKDRSSESTKVQDIMTKEVLHVQPNAEIEHCMSLMTEKRIRHLPVVEDEKVIGMISIGDLVRAVIAEQQSTINNLEKYISGQI
ncbi:MAG: CBS domain-containing protein [Gammaproteobacteria bacterium]|nr:CBS domain-containing protein [Gammaproteobacteria bacterium]